MLAALMSIGSVYAADTAVDERTKIVTISGGGEGYAEGEGITLILLKPGVDIDNVTTENAGGSIRHIFRTVADADGKYTFEIQFRDEFEGGEYRARIFGEGSSENEVEETSFYFVNDALKAELLERINDETDWDNTTDTLAEYISFDKSWFDDGKESVPNDNYKGGISVMFKKMKNALNGKKFANYEDAKNTFFLAAADVLLANNAAGGKERVTACIKHAGETLPEKFDGYYEKISANISGYTIDSAADFLDAIAAAAAVEDVNNMKRSEIKAGFEKYKKELGLENSSDYKRYTELSGEKLAKVNAALAGGGYKLPFDIQKAIKNAVDSVKGSSGSGSSGGSGSGSGGGKSGGAFGGGSKGTTGQELVIGNTDKSLPDDKARFTDLDGYEWAESAIELFREKGFVKGRAHGFFEPGDSITRAEFVCMLTQVFGLSEDDAECTYADCTKDMWFYGYAAAAEKHGLITGDGGYFRPEDKITRQDIAVILDRLVKAANISGADEKTDTEFADEKDISDYASGGVHTLYRMGVINGYEDNGFRPMLNASRAEAVCLMYRLFMMK